MTTAELDAPVAKTKTTTASLLDRAVSATKNTDKSRAEELLEALTSSALEGTVSWNKNLTKTIQEAIKKIDSKVSAQLKAVMHAPEYLKLEGSWRGLHYLLKNSVVSENLKIKLLNADKKSVEKDLRKALEFDQSELFKKVYEDEFGTPGGEPYGVLIGDYEFSNSRDDIEFLTNISGVASAGFTPFVSAASHELFGVDKWADLSKPKDLEKHFSSVEYAAWRGFRDSEDSRFVSLAMPRVLARLPYGKNTKTAESFEYTEVDYDASGSDKPLEHQEYCWMNAAYVMGARMTESFYNTGFCMSIRGVENGGKVENLPTHTFISDDGDVDMKCPTEVGITDRREAELSKMGFLPLCHYKNTDYAVFFGSQTTQKAKEYDDHDATANAAISARLSTVMATSRITHFIKVMGREKIGSFAEATDVEESLNNWITQYINTNASTGPALRASYPLADAKINVQEIPGRPGAYNAIVWLQPWMQLEELNASIKLVARIPEKQ